MTASAERLAVADRGDQSGGGQRSHAFDLSQPLATFIGAAPSSATASRIETLSLVPSAAGVLPVPFSAEDPKPG
jgi:hypothetical protein